MEFNPLARTCKDLEWRIHELSKRGEEVAEALRWYSNTDPNALSAELSQNEGLRQKLESEILLLEEDIQEKAAELAENEAATGSVLNPFNWFAMDQIDLRRKRRQLLQIRDQEVAQRAPKLSALELIRVRMTTLANDIQKHREFDPSQRQADLSNIENNINEMKQELGVLTRKKIQIDDALAPLVEQMRNLESMKRHAEVGLAAANDLACQLSSAHNSYERAMVHEECEGTFGEGSPRKVISERKRELGQLDRSLDKLKRRIDEINNKSARRIGYIVVDGNNLCYEGRSFIGLAAIEAILPGMSQDYSVTVVFDSAIRRQLRTDDSGLERRLGRYAKVHIVASRQKADETVLDLAGANDFAYVLSNDRFVDFNEKAVVRARRLIRHEIVDGNIFVHDLQLRALYSHNLEEQF